MVGIDNRFSAINVEKLQFKQLQHSSQSNQNIFKQPSEGFRKENIITEGSENISLGRQAINHGVNDDSI